MFLKLLTSALLFSTFSNALDPVGLGTAAAYLVLGGQAVTNTGPTIIDSGGNLGVSPGTSVTNFPPGVVDPPGGIHIADASAAQAQLDLVTAYNDAAGRPSATLEPTDLGGLRLTSGVYQSVPGRGPMTITSGRTLTLDAQGDPNAVWIFQTNSTLITYSSSTVLLINGAQPCNVFWQVGSSATLGTTSNFVGTLMALSSISAQTNAVIQGRLLARNGQVSLDSNKITLPNCAITTSTTSTSTTSTSTTSTSTTSTSTTSTSTTTATGPVITLPIIGPIGPILGGGIDNGGGISGGIGNHNGGGGVGNGGGGIGNSGGNGNGKGKEIGNGNGVPLAISEHNYYHDQGYDHYGAYGDHQNGANSDHYGASSDHQYGASSDHYGASSDHYGASSDRYGASSDHYGASSDHYGAYGDHYGAYGDHQSGANSHHHGASSDHQYDRTANMEDVQEEIQHAQEAADLYNARQ